jgi:hypothetical protein
LRDESGCDANVNANPPAQPNLFADRDPYGDDDPLPNRNPNPHPNGLADCHDHTHAYRDP